MATLFAVFVQVATNRETGEERRTSFIVEAEFTRGATLRESLAAARDAAWLEAIAADALMNAAERL